MGFFENVEQQIVLVNGMVDQVDVVYKVKECNIGLFNVGLGFGMDSGVSYQFGVMQDNWLGMGNSVSFNGMCNSYQFYFELGVMNLWFIVDGISLGGKIFYNSYDVFDVDVGSYNQQSYGLGSMLGFFISENNFLNLGLDYVYNCLINMDLELMIWCYFSFWGIEFSVVMKDGDSGVKYSVNDYFVSFGWGYNDFDCGFFLCVGNKSSLSGKVMFFGLDNSYYKFFFDIVQYLLLSENKCWVWMECLCVGYVGGLDGKSVLFYDNFYVGGLLLVCGFFFNIIGFKVVYYCCNGSESSYSVCLLDVLFDVVGGNVMVVLNSEFIILIFFVNDKYVDSL